MITNEDLKLFERFHDDQVNRYCHYAGLSLITLSVLGLLHHIDLRLLHLSLAAWLLIATFAFDRIVLPRFAVAVTLIGTLLLLLATQIHWIAHLLLFAIGWVIQLWGHHHEEKPPAFLSDRKHNIIGPRWMASQLTKFAGGHALEGWHAANLNPDLNDALRRALGLYLPFAARRMNKVMARKMKTARRQQQRLRTRYGINHQPPTPYTAETRKRIEQIGQRHPNSHFIYTSGSTSDPKKILYTRKRLKAFKQSSARSAIQAFARTGTRRPSMFILASLQHDASFTSLVVTKNAKGFKYGRGLVDPSQYLLHPALEPLLQTYGANAVRLWLMVLANPAMIYCTNPSTLAVFLNELQENWKEITALIRAFTQDDEALTTLPEYKRIMRVAQNIVSDGYHHRCTAITKSKTTLPLTNLLPGLTCYCCWDGGYVKPFLKQIRQHLPDTLLYIPMFSMSTETLQTELVMDHDAFRFLPLADHVYYEFLPAEQADTAASATDLLAPWELEPDREYLMIVSDPYGLLRYNTEDLFLCRGLVQGYPDLVFSHRAGLTYSFTGEKITGQQVSSVFEDLEKCTPALQGGAAQLTLFPSQASETDLPGYRLIMAHAHPEPPDLDTHAFARDFDRLLSDVNTEFKDKQTSGRLKPTEAICMPYDTLAIRLSGHADSSNDHTNRPWESQFKLTPLNRILWESTIHPPS